MTDAADRSQPHAPEANLSGRQLGNYRLLRRLGRGAMAEVYLAEQVSLHRQVAFKVLRSTLAQDQTYIQRFQREAQAAAALIHANIVQIYEVGCTEGVHFIAQEYVGGMNLHAWIKRHGAPELKLALGIMLQVAAALQKAGEQGIVHRDIKPENIMLTASGEVKVADFGLARLGRADAEVNLTQAGFTMGTPLYMSPEQVEGKPLDPRSDIYSFGVTSYHMLVGQPPFRGETALSVAVQHINAVPPAIDQLRPDLPPALCRIVHKMLAKAPQDRYPSGRELRRELRALLLNTSSLAPGAEDTSLKPSETQAFFESHQAATQRLAAVMQSPSSSSTRPSWRKWLPVVAVAAFAVGAGLAWGTRAQPLLPPVVEIPMVPKKESAEAQYVYATRVNTEEALKSVAQYFPDQPYAARAKQQLARLYLEQQNLAAALPLFQELTKETKPDLKAFGIAGEVIVLARQGQRDEAAEKLLELRALRHALSPDMRLQIKQLVGAKRLPLRQPAIWNDWADPGPGAGGESPPAKSR